MRIAILFTGLLLLVFQQYIQPVSLQLQFVFFLAGIVLLGIPHGAADLLVATKNAEFENKKFSQLKFFVNYLGRLFLFGAIIYLFPVAGNLMFILFAAYHFGETDLHHFKTNSFAGKLFVISYGLLILGVILLNHFDEMFSMFKIFDTGKKNEAIILWINNYRYSILSLFGILFFASGFFYFASSKDPQDNKGKFLLQYAVILCILYNLPMMLGFTFYFIVWHSVLSLKNIINYLRKDGIFKTKVIARQIAFYSLLAMVGMVLFGLTGFMFASNNTMIVYVFLGLAVLTAPHMQIMHNMYKSLLT